MERGTCSTRSRGTMNTKKVYTRFFVTWTLYKHVLVFLVLCHVIPRALTFNVDTKFGKLLRGPSGIYFGYSMSMLRNLQGNWLLVGAPRANDPLQPAVRTPGVLLRCPLDGAGMRCDEVVVDTTGNSPVAGQFYGTRKIFDHDKTDEWLGVAVDVSPSNDRFAVCAHRWKDSQFVIPNDLLYMQGMCYELESSMQYPARMLPILVDYNSLVHRQERYPIWAYGILGQSVRYTKNGDSLVMGAPGLNDWQGGFVIEDSFRRNFTVQPLADDRRNWLIGYTVATARLVTADANFIIAGAPRANLNGSVYIFEYKTDQISIQLVGDQLGSYFGSVLCAADVNGDQLDDVIIGAPFYSTNNTEEGRVYVYLNRGMLQLELQSDLLNGSTASQSRFGSAISSIGDINKDNYNDVAIGAPYENDGEGVVYIYNGYGGGLWPRYTQRITGSDVGTGLKAFGAALTPRSYQHSDVFAVGAYESDAVAILRVNPVVSMETKMYLRPDRITAREPQVYLTNCFKYTGNAATLQNTLQITYRMEVDTTTPEGSVRSIIVPNNVPYISRALEIRKDEYVCDEDVMIYAPYQDIWRDVQVEVQYSLDPAVAALCTQNCPILEAFNGNDPQASTQAFMKKVIQYDKQCGADNFCDTDLTLRVVPLTENGHLVYGRDQNLNVKVGLYNGNENAYNIIIDVDIAGNISAALRTIPIKGDVIVDCEMMLYDTALVTTTAVSLETPDIARHRCLVRKPYPLQRNEEVTFVLEFPLFTHTTQREFLANFTVKTEEQNAHQSTQYLRLPIKSEFGLRIEGISGPEQVTIGLQQESNTWTVVEHRYSIKNLGPSPMENAEILAYVPAIVHRDDHLVTNISVWLTSYQTDPPTKGRCYETVRDGHVPSTDSPGGYAISVDCSSFPCRRFSCSVLEFLKDRSILVSVNMSVSRQILATLQARDTVRLASRISIPEVNYGKALEKEVETMFHKTSNSMERKKLSIPIWLIIVSVVSAFLVLLVIIAILIKVGFFKRQKKEEMKRLKSTRRTSSPFADSSARNQNNTNDNSRIMESIDDDAHAQNHAHDNPGSSAHDDDDIGGNFTYPGKESFLTELQNSTSKRAY